MVYYPRDMTGFGRHVPARLGQMMQNWLSSLLSIMKKG